MDNCLIDYVGINICADQDLPDSGVFINSLPGIALESIEKIATADQVSYAGVWKDVQNAAYVRFRTAFIAALTKCFELTKKCDYESILCDNRDILLPAWMNLLGNQLMLFRLYSNRLNRYTLVDLEQAGELRDFYMVEFEKSLAQAAQLCDISECECSLVPGGQISRAEWLP